MSRRFGEPPSDWSAGEDAVRWEKFAESNGLADAQVAALCERLMKDRQLRLNETFAAYASATLPDSAWDGGWRHWTYELRMPEGVFVGGNWEPEIPIDELLPRDRAVLKASLRRSYRARSGFVHAGDRMGDGTNELLLMYPAPQADQRLSFAALRYLLRSPIDHEIRTWSTGDGDVPDPDDARGAHLRAQTTRAGMDNAGARGADEGQQAAPVLRSSALRRSPRPRAPQRCGKGLLRADRLKAQGAHQRRQPGPA